MKSGSCPRGYGTHLFDRSPHDITHDLDLRPLTESQHAGDGLVFDHGVPLRFEDVDEIRDGEV